MGVDRRIHLAQEEFLPWEMAQSIQRFMGAMPTFYKTETLQNEPGSRHGSDG